MYAIFLVILSQKLLNCTMSIIKIKDKSFKTFISEAEIQTRVKAVADKINRDLEGKNPLLLAVLTVRLCLLLT